MAKNTKAETAEALGLAPLLTRAAEALRAVDPELALELRTAASREVVTPIKGLSVPRFLALVTPLLPTLACPPPAMRTKAWFGKVGKMLRVSGLTEELAVDLARKVAAWSTQPMPVETLLAGASRYLSATDGKARPQASALGPRPMFEPDADTESDSGND